MRVRTTLSVILAMALAGCNWFEPSVEKTSQKQAQELVDSFVYAKSEKTGLCFGTTTTARMNTGGNVAYSNIVVNVPCEKVGL